MPKPTSGRHNSTKKKEKDKNTVCLQYLSSSSSNEFLSLGHAGSPARGPGFAGLSARGCTGPPQGPCGCPGRCFSWGVRTSFCCLDLKIWVQAVIKLTVPCLSDWPPVQSRCSGAAMWAAAQERWLQAPGRFGETEQVSDLVPALGAWWMHRGRPCESNQLLASRSNPCEPAAAPASPPPRGVQQAARSSCWF